jgi:enoyl-CoA hydratase
MGDYQNVKLSIEDRRQSSPSTIPRPMPLTHQTVTDLNAALDECLANDQVKVIIITGAGQFFVAGADINEIKALKGYDEAYEVVRAGQQLFSKIEQSRKAGHRRHQRPGMPGRRQRAGHGLPHPPGGGQRPVRPAGDQAGHHARLGRHTAPAAPGGQGLALEIILGGDNIKAQEAYRIGLVNKVVPVGTVVREAKRWAKVLSMWGAVAMGHIIQAVNEGLDMPLEEGAQARGSTCLPSLTATEDMREGVSPSWRSAGPRFQDK